MSYEQGLGSGIMPGAEIQFDCAGTGATGVSTRVDLNGWQIQSSYSLFSLGGCR